MLKKLILKEKKLSVFHIGKIKIYLLLLANKEIILSAGSIGTPQILQIIWYRRC